MASELELDQIQALQEFTVLWRDRKENKRVRSAAKEGGGGEHERLGRFRAGTQGRGSRKAQRHRVRTAGKGRSLRKAPGRGGDRALGAGRPPARLKSQTKGGAFAWILKPKVNQEWFPRPGGRGREGPVYFCLGLGRGWGTAGAGQPERRLSSCLLRWEGKGCMTEGTG